MSGAQNEAKAKSAVASASISASALRSDAAKGLSPGVAVEEVKLRWEEEEEKEVGEKLEGA